ncbi:MAG: hypothetical protein J6S14_21950 [Clostridia bacterium]|nr:hypothetical protein [Clostridia bacterium]
MTDTDKLNRVKNLLDPDDPNVTDSAVTGYLAEAADAIMDQLYPFGAPEGAGLPERYEPAQCTLAARYFVRRGGLGQTEHVEDGVRRAWYSSDDRDVLARIVPKARVV